MHGSPLDIRWCGYAVGGSSESELRVNALPFFFKVFRRLNALSVRAYSYFLKRAEVWHVPTTCARTTDMPSSDVAEGGAAAAETEATGLSLHGAALESLLLWLTTYRDLFSRPCCVTGSMLACDPSTQFLFPPLFRPFK